MKKKKGVLDGRFVSDATPHNCTCGKPVHFMNKGNIRLIPNGHKCKYRDAQRKQVDAIRAEEAAGVTLTNNEAAFRINGALR